MNRFAKVLNVSEWVYRQQCWVTFDEESNIVNRIEFASEQIQ